MDFEFKGSDCSRRYKIQVRKYLEMFLYREEGDLCWVFFLWYFMDYFGWIVIDQSTNTIIFALCLLTIPFTHSNPYLYYIPLLSLQNPLLNLLSLTLGLCSINQPLKLPILIFTLNYHISALSTPSPTYISIYQIIIAIFIVWKIYGNLYGKSREENIMCFVGFGMIGVVNLMEVVVEGLGGLEEVDWVFKCGVIVLVFSVLMITIIRRITQIQNKQNHNNGHLIYHHIHSIEISIQKSLKFYQQHIETCNQPTCFCQKHQNILSEAYPIIMHHKLINHLYLQAFKNPQLSSSSTSSYHRMFLIYKYSKFLLHNKQYQKCYKILSTTFNFSHSHSHSHHYLKTLQHRITQQLTTNLSQQNYFLINRQCFQKVDLYDRYLGYLKKQMYLIMTSKIVFWSQLCKINTKLAILERQGINIMEKIQFMHEVFMERVFPMEKLINNYNGTILYCGYLNLTTNYGEVAENLLKQVNKCVSQITLSTPINISCISFTINQINHLHKLLIKNISTTLTKSLQHPKSTLLNTNIQQLIPQYFRTTHSQRFNNWFTNINYDSQFSPFFNNILKLPFRVSLEEIYVTKMEARLAMGEEGLEFRVICFGDQRRCRCVMVDLEGNLMYWEKGVQQRVIRGEQFQQIIRSIREDYHRYHNTETRILSLQLQCNHYQVTFSFFSQISLCKTGYKPLLLIQLQDQNQTPSPTPLLTQTLHPPLTPHNTQLQTSQSLSISPPKNLTQDIYKALQNRTIASSKQFLLFLLISVIMVIGGQLTEKFVYEGVVRFQVPMSYVISYQVISGFMAVMSIQKDQQLYREGDVQYLRLLGRSVRGRDYLQTKNNKIHELSETLQQNLQTNLIGKNNYLTKYYLQKLKKTLIINFPSLPLIPQQQLTLKQIIMRLIIQLRYINTLNYSKSLLHNSFLPQIYPQLLNITQQSKTIIQLENNNQINVYIGVCCVIVVGFMGLAGYFLRALGYIKSGVLQIYMLLGELGTSMLRREINKLIYIRNTMIINQYNYNNGSGYTINDMGKQSTYQLNKTQFVKEFVDIMIPDDRRKTIIKEGKKKDTNMTQGGIRMRPADIIVQGSLQSKWRIPKFSAIYYIFILLFITKSLLLSTQTSQISQQTTTLTNQLHLHLEQINQDILQLLLSKKFFDRYTLKNRLYFQGEDLMQWLKQRIYKQNENDDNNGNDSQENVQFQMEIQECQDEGDLICKLEYSYSALRGVVKRGVFDCYQEKMRQLEAQKKQIKYIPQFNPKQLRSQLFLSQQAIQKILKLSSNHTQQILQIYNQQKQQIQNHISSINNIYSVIIGLFVCYCGLLYWQRRGQYMRNLAILLFMNKQMMFRNKRVESFVERLVRDRG